MPMPASISSHSLPTCMPTLVTPSMGVVTKMLPKKEPEKGNSGSGVHEVARSNSEKISVSL